MSTSAGGDGRAHTVSQRLGRLQVLDDHDRVRTTVVPKAQVGLISPQRDRLSHGPRADLAAADTLRWLDLRPALRPMLDAVQIDDLDLSIATGQHRHLTQAIARELRLHANADAIQYPSRYGAPTTCYACSSPPARCR